ncbi:hypothetical protein Lrub_1237 [Legionella rubrilucens]|uniref:RavJ-like C-terminal domain-containing protein n=1 Tax=Legionella rubrilucens TaxID=458 RepID=A0A0W0XWK4_9GAMM|nr:DUF5617 domain-containing protein [Legionella rubrilucens]KTD48886.1 hypothetical protein Lrub_1237 [Legionella rubrilucens]
MKIFITGTARSGKSTLRLLLAGDRTSEVPTTLSYGAEQSQFEIDDEKITLEEAVMPADLFGYWTIDSEALLYCVDLSRANPRVDVVDHAIEDIMAFQKVNPHAPIILVGTHADKASNPAEKLLEINKLYGNRFDRAVAVSMAPKKILKEDFVDNLRQDVLGPLLVKKSPQETMETVVVVRQVHKYPKPPKPFPHSYERLWQTGAGPSDKLESEVSDFRAALEILRDYSKSNNPDTCSFFGSTVKLAFTRHLLRHHTDVVDELYKQYYNKDHATAGDLINELKEKLISQGDKLNRTGSLAQRIRFIERKANLEPTDFFALNQKIAERKITVSAPK